MDITKGHKFKIIAIILGIIAALLTFIFPVASYGQAEERYEKGKISFTDNLLRKYKIAFEGYFELSDDDTDIVSISDGGYFDVSRFAFGNRRRVLIQSGRDGRLIKKYFIGRDEEPFEPDGREWLAEVLPEIVTESTIGAQSRVDRFYKKNGVAGVLSEIRDLRSTYLQTHYYNLLLEKDLNPAELREVIRSVGDEIDSDYYLSEILTRNQKLFMDDEEALSAFVEASEGVESDHYRSEILKELLDEDLDTKVLAAIIRSTKSMDSNHYLAEVLTELLDKDNLEDEDIELLIEAAQSLNSNHYRARVLEEALEHRNISEKSQGAILEAVEGMSSNHYKTEIFKEILEQGVEERVLIQLLGHIADGISSDHYSHVLLSEIVNEYTLSDEVMRSVSEALSEIGSDHYKSQVIMEALESDGISENQALQLLEISSEISSDHYLAEVLIEMAEFINDYPSRELKDAYRRAAKAINSDTYYGKALKALD